MMVGMLVAGIGLVLVGLLAIGYGISIQEFSVGNTLILTGVIGVCSGAILLGLWMAVRELRNIAQRLGAGVPEARGEAAVRPAAPVAATRDSAKAGRLPGRRAVRRQAPSRHRRRRLLPRHRRRGRTKLSSRDHPMPAADAPRTATVGQTEAQFAVFIDVAKRARTRPGAVQRGAAAGSFVAGPSPQAAHRAAGRDRRTAARIVRRCLAESGTRKARRNFAAAA